MITTQDEYETALERLIACLEHPSHAADDDEDLASLLADVERYAPTPVSADAAPSAAHQGEIDALMASARALVAAREDQARRQRYATFPEDGEGIGPTTGV